MPRRRLGDIMPWNEIVKKIMKDCNNNDKKFRDWLMTKENLGGYLFSSLLWLKCYNIYKSIKYDKQDHIVVITGEEGCGKTTLGAQISAVVDPTFNIRRYVYNALPFFKALKKLPKYSAKSILVDEGARFLFSRDSGAVITKRVVKKLTECRIKGACISICIPNFFILEKYIRTERCRTWIRIPTKNHHSFILYSKKAVEILSVEGGKRRNSIAGLRVPNGSYFYGTWANIWPKLKDFHTYEDYEDVRVASFNDSCQEDIEVVRGIESRDLLTLSDASDLLPFEKKTIMSKLASGELKGKKIGGRWFMSRKYIEKLIKVDGGNGKSESSEDKP